MTTRHGKAAGPPRAARRVLAVIVLVATTAFGCASLNVASESSVMSNAGQEPAQSESAPSTVAILLYSVELSEGTAEPLYYNHGFVHAVSSAEETKNQMGGHSPWKLEPIPTTTSMTANLMPAPLRPGLYDATENPEPGPCGTLYRGSHGIRLFAYGSDPRKSTRIAISVPDLGRYVVTLVKVQLIYVVQSISLVLGAPALQLSECTPAGSA